MSDGSPRTITCARSMPSALISSNAHALTSPSALALSSSSVFSFLSRTLSSSLTSLNRFSLSLFPAHPRKGGLSRALQRIRFWIEVLFDPRLHDHGHHWDVGDGDRLNVGIDIFYRWRRVLLGRLLGVVLVRLNGLLFGRLSGCPPRRHLRLPGCLVLVGQMQVREKDGQPRIAGFVIGIQIGIVAAPFNVIPPPLLDAGNGGRPVCGSRRRERPWAAGSGTEGRTISTVGGSPMYQLPSEASRRGGNVAFFRTSISIPLVFGNLFWEIQFFWPFSFVMGVY